jgi:hypothetical protein
MCIHASPPGLQKLRAHVGLLALGLLLDGIQGDPVEFGQSDLVAVEYVDEVLEISFVLFVTVFEDTVTLEKLIRIYIVQHTSGNEASDDLSLGRHGTPFNSGLIISHVEYAKLKALVGPSA